MSEAGFEKIFFSQALRLRGIYCTYSDHEQFLSWLDALITKAPQFNWRRLPPTTDVEALSGGIDIAASLAARKTIRQAGILHTGISQVGSGQEVAGKALALIIPNFRQLPMSTCQHLLASMEKAQADFFVVLGDWQTRSTACAATNEGLADVVALEPAQRRLIEACALHTDAQDDVPEQAELNLIDHNSEKVKDWIEVLVKLSHGLGISSVQLKLQALCWMRAHAALNHRQLLNLADLNHAIRWVLLPRATQLPQAQESHENTTEQAEANAQSEEQAVQPETGEAGNTASKTDALADTQLSSQAQEKPQQTLSAEDMLVAAALAKLPLELLAQYRQRRITASLGTRPPLNHLNGGKPVLGARRLSFRASSAKVKGIANRVPRAGERLDVYGTLRAALPWQKLRSNNDAKRICFRKQDLQVQAFTPRQSHTTVFLVDASGSSAMNRLAEAKGAVELLLAQAYQQRDQVSLIAFRGQEAKLVLPPTRSLVRAKRSLSAMAAGGATPLSTALIEARRHAQNIRRDGRSVQIVILSDGRPNICQDGRVGRELALQESLQVAAQCRRDGLQSLFIDISLKAQVSAQQIACAMNAGYLFLPMADAQQISAAVKQAHHV